VDQQTAGGAATGTPATRYIHPDHLGSTILNLFNTSDDNMKRTFETLTILVKSLTEEQLAASIPVFSQLVHEIVEEIRASNDYKSAEII
jgi:hypothetical protein